MFISYSGYRLFFRLALLLVLFMLIGALFNQVVIVMLLGSIALLVWHYRQLTRLNFWLWKDKKLTPPQGRGSWEGVFNGIYRLQGKNRRRVGQLATLLARFRQGAEALPDAAVVLDAEHNILWCNKLAQLILGFVWPQDNGQRIDNLIRHPDFSTYIKKAQYKEPLEIPSPVSDKRLLEIRVMSYGDRQLLLIARDVTRIHQLEGMRKDFVANVSHELKTPLTVLQGYLEIMQTMEDADSPNHKPLSLMQQQTTRMQSMVEQLLALSRIEDAVDIDLSQTVNMSLMMEILKEEAKALAGTDYTLVFNCEPGLNTHGNELQLRSACSNLISNAIRYTSPGGTISVNWQSVATGALFSVADTGVGIAPQHINRLTERFYRVDNARSSKTGGSGLGLAIVKHALNHHHSELKVTSEYGKGSIFSFVIPSHLLVRQ
ncbi:phosphate regulon sensor histidine kinase PhoR [Shewanella frigidimarina]|jgi:two-component system phosphate regulon sensor histidine kinase PhoR|uniref:Phosphate regulon sensor protein PhoR n=3 Tax=Gammaproteobacteria TaxID=1236 RepID=Q07ZF7_SHEFN|nr:phosphate regulon sensor histidine kinase PhoR [Shewanella frigidimarina]ABI72607.1 PAS/PAC sensor signal transduction histidine kinase [Shewanella frigidimarina NCIMB 400]RPA38254.1 phosphate regulon sensor histidine kinase PhoR [Shewanella frigidimarina]RPA63754.1 phosphate regulon sensor histidine kinase PhoR [Shewanella frigidimarina]HBF45192.1 two-component system sensor histidine kinase PhoR [Shewanella frigidimarina]|tara:strand:- start:793 stop:2088 length:1296 start_codon:yes stop_codon:yes gene_type:complete